MKSFSLDQMHLQELTATEMVEIDGGFPVFLALFVLGSCLLSFAADCIDLMTGPELMSNL